MWLVRGLTVRARFLDAMSIEISAEEIIDAMTPYERAQFAWVSDLAPMPPDVWIESNFYLYDTASLMTLHPTQRGPLFEALRTDENGNYLYNTVLWSWPKKSAKSSIISAVVHYVASHRPNAQIMIIGNDQRQSDSRVGHYLRENLKHGTKMGNATATGAKIGKSNYRIDYPNNALVEMLPIDPTGEAGGNPDLLVFSELWGWKSKAHQKMWTEMTLSPTKFGSSQRWIDTYAGFDGESPILEKLYATGMKGDRLSAEDMGGNEYVWSNRDARLLMVWVQDWYLPWQTDAAAKLYYRQEEEMLLASEFRRMHKNQWGKSVAQFISEIWWLACQARLSPADSKTPVIIALDAGITNDSFGLIMASYDKPSDVVSIRYEREWVPPKGGEVDLSEPENEVKALCRRFNVKAVVYDPYQLKDMAQRLQRERVVDTVPFQQGSKRAIADKAFRDRIKDKRVRHDNAPLLTQHVRNANAEPASDSRIRIVKRNPALKIDLAVCASMACHAAPEYCSTGVWYI